MKGGFVLIPLFLIAQVGWFYVFERLWALRSLSYRQHKFWRDAPSDSSEFHSYLENVRISTKGLFKQLLDDVVDNKSNGEKAMVNAVKARLSFEADKMQKHLSTIAVMAASAPLLGLLGTVSGMVATFQIITQYGTGNPAMMAEGISEALLTTQAGLIVSFPLVLMHNHLLNRADKIENECISGATQLINGLR